MRHIVLDTETTGLSRKSDRVVEIAAMEFNPETGETADYYHVYLNPDQLMPANIVRIHGISNAFAQTQPRFEEEAAAFVGFIRGARLFIHNAPFDRDMLDAEFARLELDELTSYVESIVCTVALAKSVFPGKRNSLDALCDRFGVNRSKRRKHGALIDCELLAEVVPHLHAAKEGRTLALPVAVREESWLRALARRCLGSISAGVR